MKKVIRLTESDLTRLVKRVIKEYRPYGKSLQDLEDSFWNKDEFLGDMQWGLHNKVYEPNKQKHYEKLNNLKTYYADKMVYDFLQNPNFTSEENTKLEELDEKLSNPNLGSDKIERFKNLKREIYQKAFDRYLDTLDKRHLDQYFIGQKYPYFKDKIKDFVYTGNAPSEPMTPNPNFIQRTAKKVKDYFRSSENEKLTETDLTRIVKRVIKEESQSVDTVCLKQAGYKETNIGGPMTRRIVYEKKNGNVLRQISLKGGTLEKFVGDKKYKCSCNCKNGVVTESNCKESSKEVY